MQEDLELVTRECKLHALPGALGRYLEHLFGAKPYPWAKFYVKQPPPPPPSRSGLLEVQITVLTPFPGTPLYDRFRREGRLLKERYWDRCTLFDVNYTPKGMTVQQLEEGLKGLFRDVYNEAEYVKRQRRYMEIVKAREP